MITHADVVAEAREWLGTLWRHGQWLKRSATKKGGCDCIGLVAGVARELGLPEGERFRNDIRFRGYGRTPDEKMLRLAVAEYLDPVERAQPGDIVLMDHERQPFPHHFGILSAPDYVIHAYASARKVVENRIDEKWRSRIVGAFSYRGVA